MAQATYLVLIDRGRNSSLFRKVSSSFIPPTPLLCLSLSVRQNLSVCLYVYMSLSFCLSLPQYLHVCSSVCLSLSGPVPVLLRQSIYTSASVSLSASLPPFSPSQYLPLSTLFSPVQALRRPWPFQRIGPCWIGRPTVVRTALLEPYQPQRPAQLNQEPVRLPTHSPTHPQTDHAKGEIASKTT